MTIEKTGCCLNHFSTMIFFNLISARKATFNNPAIAVILLICINFLPASGQNNFTQDSTLAAQYMEEAKAMHRLDTTFHEPLEKAISIYQRLGLVKEEVIAKGYYAFKLGIVGFEKLLSEKLAGEALALASENGLEKEKKYAWLALIQSYSEENYDLAYHYADSLQDLILKPSPEYFELNLALFYTYHFDKKNNLLEKKVQEMKQFFESDATGNYKFYEPFYWIGEQYLELSKLNYESSIIYGNKALAIHEKSPILFNHDIGNLLSTNSNSYRDLGEFQAAIDCINTAIELAKPYGGEFYMSNLLGNLAVIYSQNGQFDKAVELGDQTIKIHESQTIKNGEYLQILHTNNASYCIDLKNFEKAKYHLREAKKYGDSFFIDLQFSKIYSYEGNDKKALEAIQESIIKMSIEFDNSDIHTNPHEFDQFYDEYWASFLLSNKATYFFNIGREEQSIFYFKKAIQTGELAISIINRSFAESLGFEQNRLGQNRNIDYAKTIIASAKYEIYALEKSPQNFDNAFLAIEEKKSSVLLNALTPSPLSPALASREQALKNAVLQAKQQVVTAPSDSVNFYQNQLFELNQDIKSFVGDLKEKGLKQLDYLYAIDYATRAEVQRTLDEKTILLDYVFSQQVYFIAIVSKDTFDILKLDIPEAFIDNLQSFRKTIQHPLLIQKSKKETFFKASAQLYKALIAPIEPFLEGKEQIIVIPDNDLFYIPFEVLTPSAELKSFAETNFLMKDYAINYHYSATAYKQAVQKKAAQDGSLLAFAPIFENGQEVTDTYRDFSFAVDSLFRGIDENEYVPLPNTSKEVKEIAKLTPSPKNKVLINEQATKQALLTSLVKEPYQYIHIATHGFVNYEKPEFSGVACAANATNSKDALLFANEIKQLELNADLVVLSSCESGIGQLFSGEGMIALNRSFTYAGAKNVLFSLWKVNDKYSSELMIDFYKEIKKGKSYTAALRAAKLKMLSNPKTASPRYWAPFVLMGE